MIHQNTFNLHLINIVFYSKKMFNLLFASIKDHLKLLYEQLDPIRVKESEYDERKQRQFLFAFLIIFFTILYGLFGLQYESNGFIDIQTWKTDSSIFTHRIVPKSIWKFIDFGTFIDFASLLIMFLALYWMKPVRFQFRLYSDGYHIYRHTTGKYKM